MDLGKMIGLICYLCPDFLHMDCFGSKECCTGFSKAVGGKKFDRWLSPYPHLNLLIQLSHSLMVKVLFLQFSTKLKSSKHCSCLLFWVRTDCYLSILVYGWGDFLTSSFISNIILVDHFIWTCPTFALHFVHSKRIQVSLSHARNLLPVCSPKFHSSTQAPYPVVSCLFLFWMIRAKSGLAYPATTNTKGVEQSLKFPTVLPPHPFQIRDPWTAKCIFQTPKSKQKT